MRAPFFAVVSPLLAAAPAAACGACNDAMVQSLAWWMLAVPALAAVLWLEIPVTAIAWRLLRRRPAHPRAARALVGCVAFVVGAAFPGGLFMGSLARLVVLVPAFARSLRGEEASRRVRVAGVVAATVVLGLVPAHPTFRDTDALIAMATTGPATRSAWVERELATRGAADVVARAALDEPSSHRSVWITEMHRRAFGDTAAHRALCQDVFARMQREQRDGEGQRRALTAACPTLGDLAVSPTTTTSGGPGH